MKDTILLIDGENFIHKVKNVLEANKLKYSAVDIRINDLLSNPLKKYKNYRKVFYGAKLRYHSDTPAKSEELIKSQRKLINNLRKQGFEYVKAGNVRGQLVGKKTVFREKGVDVRIAVDMVSLACDKKVKTIILCSSDSDLQPAIEEVIKRKVKVIYLGFERSPNKGITFTTDTTILLKDTEILSSIS